MSNYLCAGTVPPNSQSCNTQACTGYAWKEGNWGTCQSGVQDRTVFCERDDGVIV